MVDLADAHLKALKALENNSTGFTCNLGTGIGSSVLEVIVAFERATEIKIPSRIYRSSAFGDVVEALADPSLAEELLAGNFPQG